MPELKEVFEMATKQTEPDRDSWTEQERRQRRTVRNRKVGAFAVAAAIGLAAVALVVATLPRESTTIPGGGPAVSPEPTVLPDTEAGLVGLPPEGATPSTPEQGRLVLYLEGNVSGPPTALWVYADGRLIWGDVFGYLPDGAPTEGATGFVEQHLTPAGVEFLRTQVISTGLFEHDLALLRGPGDPPFLTIQVRNGDRLVWLTWAVEENYRVPKDAPPATPEQAGALEGIYALLTDPTSWPASAWEDQDPETFVPSRYRVWLRIFPDRGPGSSVTVGEREVALLPAPARDLLRRATMVDDTTYELTTDETRALAEALNESGLEPLTMPMGEAVLRYGLEDPYAPGNSLFVFFGPVLPHGEAIFLGPG